MKKPIILLLVICIGITGCNSKKKDTAGQELPQVTETNIETAVLSEQDIRIQSFAVDAEKNIYYFHTAEAGTQEEASPGQPEERTALYVLDAEHQTKTSYTFNEHFLPRQMLYEEQSILYIVTEYSGTENRFMPVLYQYQLGEDTPQKILALEAYTNVLSMEMIAGTLYILAENPVKKEQERQFDEGEYTTKGEELISIVLGTKQTSVIDIACPVFMSKTTDNKLLLYGYKRNQNFYLSVYNPADGTETERVYPEIPLLSMIACGEESYIFHASSNDSIQNINIGSLLTDAVKEIPVGTFVHQNNQSKFLDGMFYFIDGNAVNQVDLSNYLDFTEERQINIISAESIAYVPASYGFQVNKAELGEEQFALTVLSLDEAYDICYVDSTDSFAANLRDKGAFYPLNEVEGVREYIDACFPSIKEAAINEDGDIWMIPLYFRIPSIVYNEKLCESLGILFSSDMELQEFVEIVKSLYQEGEYQAVYGISAQNITDILLGQYIQGNTKFDTPEFRELAELIKKDIWGNEAAFTYSTEMIMALGSMDKSNIAFIVESYLPMMQMYSSIEGYQVLPLPLLDEQKSNYAACIFAAVNPYSKNLETTLEYISFIAETLTEAEYMPERYDQVFNIQTAEIFETQEFYQGVADIMKESIVGFSLSDELFRDDFYRYIHNEIPLEALITEADRKLHAYLNE